MQIVVMMIMSNDKKYFLFQWRHTDQRQLYNKWLMRCFCMEYHRIFFLVLWIFPRPAGSSLKGKFFDTNKSSISVLWRKNRRMAWSYTNDIFMWYIFKKKRNWLSSVKRGISYTGNLTGRISLHCRRDG